jgi:hypothetical protein
MTDEEYARASKLYGPGTGFGFGNADTATKAKVEAGARRFEAEKRTRDLLESGGGWVVVKNFSDQPVFEVEAVLPTGSQAKYQTRPGGPLQVLPPSAEDRFWVDDLTYVKRKEYSPLVDGEMVFGLGGPTVTYMDWVGNKVKWMSGGKVEITPAASGGLSC